MATDVLGTPVKRVEDPRFITGTGSYLDDIKLPGDGPHWPSCAARTPTRTSARSTPPPAQGHAGRARGLHRRGHPVQPAAHGLAGGRRVGHPEQRQHARASLATDDVKWTGEGVAAVIAETPEQAQDALDAHRRRLGAAAGRRGRGEGDPAGRAAAPRERPQQRRVRVARRRQGRHGRRLRRRRGRRPPAARQPAADPQPDGGPGRHRPVQPGHGRVHHLDVQPDAAHPAAAAHRLRDRASRSTRCAASAPTSAAPSAPRSSATPTWRSSCSRRKPIGGRPVKWVESRRENYQSTIHGRDHITYIEVAATRDGEVTGLRVKTYANLGGRLSTIGPGIPTTLYGRVLSGPYKIPNVYCEVTGVYTNTDVRGRLPRRRAARGDVRRRAGHGPRRGRAGHRPGGDPAAQLPAARRLPVRQPVRARDRGRRRQDLHRLRQLRAGARQGARDGRLRRPRRGQGRGAQARQAPRPRPLDLHRGLRRRAVASGSAPSARAGAPRCGSRPTSRST